MSEFKKLMTTLEDNACLLAQILNEIQELKNQPTYTPQPPYVVPTVWPQPTPTPGPPGGPSPPGNPPPQAPVWVGYSADREDKGQSS